MNVALDPWKQEDIPSLVQHANNFNIWKTVKDSFPHPYTIKDAEEWIALNQHNKPHTNFSIKVDGRLTGGAGILLKTDIYKKNIEIGYWLGEPFWGKGIATQAVGQLTAYAFSNFDINRIYAEIFSNNPSSMKVLCKNGFRQESIQNKSIFKSNQFLDGHIWVKYKAEI